MCTVTYLPLPSGGFVLTSTRDEKTDRKPALGPREYDIHGEKVVFPRDGDAGGTWIASSAAGHTLCLLNGAFRIYERQPPYRMSRGLVLLDFFRYRDTGNFCSDYDFRGIEPFTLLVIAHEPRRLDQLRWDGERVHRNAANPENPGIWFSVALYPDEVIRKRRKEFRHWLATDPGFHTPAVVGFHKQEALRDIPGEGPNGENGVRSLSITSVYRNPPVHDMYYEDLVKEQTHHHNISGNPLLIL